MFLLIDKQRMVVVHRHESNSVLSNLAYIEMAHCPGSIFEESRRCNWAEFGYTDLSLLYEGLVGIKHSGHMKSILIDLLMRLSLTIEPSQVDAFESILQAKSIKGTDKGNYQYVWGSTKPKELEDLFEGKGRKGSLTQAMALPLQTPATAPQQPVTAAQTWTPSVPLTPPKYPPPWA